MPSENRRHHLRSLPAETTAREAALSWLRKQRRAPESERLLTALRLRGFLCIPAPDGDGVFLSPSHAGDLRLLPRAVAMAPLEHREWGWRVRGKGPGTELFPPQLDQPKGLTSVGYEAHTVGSAITYRKMHHGVRAMLAPLDVGVALLVRALPLVGVATWESCDGHAKQAARVRLCTTWDAVWLDTVLQVVFSRLCTPALQPACRWTVSVPDRRLSICPHTAHSGAELLHDTWAVAEVLMRPALHQALRGARTQALEHFDPHSPPTADRWRTLCQMAVRPHVAPRLTPQQPLIPPSRAQLTASSALSAAPEPSL